MPTVWTVFWRVYDGQRVEIVVDQTDDTIVSAWVTQVNACGIDLSGLPGAEELEREARRLGCIIRAPASAA